MAKITINKDYKAQIESIAVDGHKYGDKAMNDVYKSQKSELDSLHNFIGMLFIKYSTKGLLVLNSSQKASIISQVKSKLTLMGKSLSNSEITSVTDILTDVYKETYNKNAFILNQKFKELDNKIIKDSVTSKTEGESFSDRIIGHKADLIDKIQDHVKTALLGAVTIDVLGSQIQDRFSVTAYQSKLLQDNENSRVQREATDEVAADAEVEQVMWSSTLDDKTEDEDASLDGQVWGINETHPIPVEDTHIGCRCVLINVPYPGWKSKERKDNTNKEIIPATDYKNWKAGKSEE